MKKFLLTIAAVLTATLSYAQTELLTNGGFEEWTGDVPTGWLAATDANGMTAGSNVNTAKSTDDVHGGATAVALTNKTAGASKENNGRLATNEITLKPGTYTFSVYVKAAADQAATRLGYTPVTSHKVGSYTYGKNKNEYNGPDTISTDWTKLTYEFTLEEQKTLSLVIMHSKNFVASTVLVDDASLTTTDGGIAEGGETGGETGGEIEGTITVAEAQAAAAGTTATVQGSVYATGASSFVVGDKTGFIFHYGAADVKVGDVVTVTGEVSAYGGFNQFKSAKVEVVSAGTVTYPTPTIMTGAEMDEWVAAPDIDYVQITGKLTISGNYYNVNVEGAEKAVGSIIAPNDEIKAKLSNGNTYVLTGFAMYQSGTNKYMNIVVTDAKAEGETVELNDISNTIETAYTVSEAIKLIEDEKSDLSKTVYVKGIISAPLKEGNPICDTQYGNATFFISADGSTEGEQFEIYRGYWFEGAKFTAEDQLKIGDAVIFECTITKYTHSSGDVVYETNTGAKLVSLNGSTDAIQGITAEKDAVIYDLAGRRVSKAVKGLYIINGKKVMK